MFWQQNLGIQKEFCYPGFWEAEHFACHEKWAPAHAIAAPVKSQSHVKLWKFPFTKPCMQNGSTFTVTQHVSALKETRVWCKTCARGTVQPWCLKNCAPQQRATLPIPYWYFIERPNWHGSFPVLIWEGASIDFHVLCTKRTRSSSQCSCGPHFWSRCPLPNQTILLWEALWHDLPFVSIIYNRPSYGFVHLSMALRFL